MQQLTVNTTETFEYPKVNGNLGYFLVELTQVGETVYCVCTQTGDIGLVKFSITENDSPTATSGEVQLVNAGSWDMKIYEQASSTNLIPIGTPIIEDVVEVTGDATSLTVFVGDCCTGEGGGDPVSITNQDGTEIDTVACGGEYQVIVVSRINGGNSDTTYSNSIIGNP